MVHNKKSCFLNKYETSFSVILYILSHKYSELKSPFHIEKSNSSIRGGGIKIHNIYSMPESKLVKWVTKRYWYNNPMYWSNNYAINKLTYNGHRGYIEVCYHLVHYHFVDGNSRWKCFMASLLIYFIKSVRCFTNEVSKTMTKLTLLHSTYTFRKYFPFLTLSIRL